MRVPIVATSCPDSPRPYTTLLLPSITRNSYCCICTRYAELKGRPHEHVCFKNWRRTPTAMEAGIIVEGFKHSMSMHRLKFGRIIGKYDSPRTMSQLRYIYMKVCSNHILKNYSRRLREVGKKTRYAAGLVPVSVIRSVSAEIQLRLSAAVTGAMKYRSAQKYPSLQERIGELKNGIQNDPFHVSVTTACVKKMGIFVNGRSKVGESGSEFENSGHIIAAKNLVALHASRLIHNVPTNQTETFNSIVCKYVGGKRFNHVSCQLIDVNSGGKMEAILYKIEKFANVTSNAKNFPRQSDAKDMNKTQEKVKRKHLVLSGPDCRYGLESNVPDLDSPEFQKKNDEFLTSLVLSDEDRNSLQVNTTAQGNCDLWKVERHKRLTASSFGRLCKMRNSTPRA
ncbi:hypothetical protein PR048_001683 [Dryococelus australis]|uniref:Mutator-like transposase domain-containing protein n=1 Tax=Dryococelus australis TaxID=614101 RepID=A0ABQ9II74_9NEOP|nr:hypothetical protein PR048_001683 [Dryococelus australis]